MRESTAAPKGVTPRISEVNIFGKLETKPWPTQLRWIWMSTAPGSALRRPALRVAVQLPYKLAGSRINGAGYLQARVNPPGSPFTGKGAATGGGDVVSIDLDGPSTSFNLEVIDPKSRKVTVRSFILKLQAEESVIWVDPSCEPLKLKLFFPAAKKNFLYAGMKCVREPTKGNPASAPVTVAIFHSSDLKLRVGGRLKRKSEGPAWVELTGRAADFASKSTPYGGYSSEAFRIDLLPFAEGGNRSMDALVLYVPNDTGPRWTLTLGIGITMASYTENPGNIHLSQISLTPKVTVNYAAIPGLIDLSVNGFMNALNLSHAPSDVTEARFWGANGRVGYHLPFSSPDTTYVFSLGYYMWGMFVDDQSYGLSFVSGPQVFLSARHAPGGSARPFGGYFKVALVNETTSLSNAGKEIALGGFYQLSAPGTKYPISLTLDAAFMSFMSPTILNSSSLNTYTLGVQTTF